MDLTRLNRLATDARSR